ncbi:MAG: hypothetical protein KF850_31050 [Labilithrix sp.]|nr:hypothetical protein [Labilithrix sp.]
MRKLDRALVAMTGLALCAAAGAGCKGPMAKIEAVRDALVTDDATPIREATAGYPTCGDEPPAVVPVGKPGPRDAGCLSDIANALGSKQGFAPSPPDHAAATTAALVITRDGRGDWLSHPDTWLGDLKNGKGVGHDALRLAVARRMAEGAQAIGRKIDDQATASAAMKAVVAAVPGACPTYWLLGSGADPKTIPVDLTADHAACVQRDLARREGPGASYGSGHLRAVEGALALWRETERALRMGLPLAEPGPKAVLQKKLAVIEEATRKNETVKLEPVPDAVLTYMGEVHAEAGVVIMKARDAGPDAADSDAAAAAAAGDAGSASDAAAGDAGAR